MPGSPVPRRVTLRGRDLIREPLLNKGSAFSAQERREFGLEGLLPGRILTMERQAERIMATLARDPDPLARYVTLAALQDRNEHLYYHVLVGNLETLMPVVYTPTVGQATRQFSHVFQRGRGVWITPEHRGRIRAVLAGAAAGRNIRLLVVTDNESILGIGDQGAGGMAIAIGKLALYTAIAGVDPARVLPVSLDVGTDNAALLADPLYVGYARPRLRGAEYAGLLDEFVEAVAAEMPGALLQWEDLRKDNALAVLDRYRTRLPSFNDDIQGTGAVTLAGLLTAGRITGRALRDERIVILGAGAAGLGIARQLRAALGQQGLSPDAARTAVAVLDRAGLIIADGNLRDPYKAELAWPLAAAQAAGLAGGPGDLAAVVRGWQPTVLIGTSGQSGAFSEAIVREMAARTERPVILPLSNPTDQAEATPADLATWTGGRALVATGSPFPDYTVAGQPRAVGQGNNAFIFPAVGLASLAGGIRVIDDGLFTTAAQALAEAVTGAELDRGLLYPAIGRARTVCLAVAVAVLQTARERGWATTTVTGTLGQQIRGELWEPVYVPYEPG